LRVAEAPLSRIEQRILRKQRPCRLDYLPGLSGIAGLPEADADLSEAFGRRPECAEPHPFIQRGHTSVLAAIKIQPHEHLPRIGVGLVLLDGLRQVLRRFLAILLRYRFERTNICRDPAFRSDAEIRKEIESIVGRLIRN